MVARILKECGEKRPGNISERPEANVFEIKYLRDIVAHQQDSTQVLSLKAIYAGNAEKHMAHTGAAFRECARFFLLEECFGLFG